MGSSGHGIWTITEAGRAWLREHPDGGKAEIQALTRAGYQGRKANGRVRPLVVNWIVFCYQIKLYRETAALFRPIGPDLVDKALYEHVRKIAQACEVRLK